MNQGDVAEARSVKEFMPATAALAPGVLPVSSSCGSSLSHAGFGGRDRFDSCALVISSGNA